MACRSYSLPTVGVKIGFNWSPSWSSARSSAARFQYESYAGKSRDSPSPRPPGRSRRTSAPRVGSRARPLDRRGGRPIRSSSTSAASTTACCDAAGPGELMAHLPRLGGMVAAWAAAPGPPPRTSAQPAHPRPGRPPAGPVTGAQPAAAAQHRRDNDIGLGQHDDQASRVAPGDDHARSRGQPQRVSWPPAQHPDDGTVTDPARDVYPAGPVHRLIRQGGDLGHRRQGSRRARPALPPAGQPDGHAGE